MSRLIFHLEDRSSLWIYHWIIFVVAGLRHIKNGGSHCPDGKPIEQNRHLFTFDMLQPPYNVYIKKMNIERITENENHYIKETFDLIKDEFILINEDDIKVDDIILNNYGELSVQDVNNYITYDYVKNLLERNIKIDQNDIERFSNKKFYLCRSHAYLLAGNANDTQSANIKRRHIQNENELVNILINNEVECIFLEKYSLVDKIKLFKLASLIISPNSGGLTFSLFAAPTKTSIVEIHVNTPHQISHQFSNICKCFNISYYKVIASKIDHLDNMHIDPNMLINMLKSNNLI